MERRGPAALRLRLPAGEWLEVTFEETAQASRCEAAILRARRAAAQASDALEEAAALPCTKRRRTRASAPAQVGAALEPGEPSPSAALAPWQRPPVAAPVSCVTAARAPSPPASSVAAADLAEPAELAEHAEPAQITEMTALASPVALGAPAAATARPTTPVPTEFATPCQRAHASARLIRVSGVKTTVTTGSYAGPAQGIADVSRFITSVPGSPAEADEWAARWKDGKVLMKNCLREVQQAVDRQSGEVRVVKVVNKRALKLLGLRGLRAGVGTGGAGRSLRREVEVLKSLRHERVVTLLEFYETDSSMYLVMEFLEGGDLFHAIKDRGNLPEAEARRLFHELCEAVEYLHSENVVHRDLKLENILLTEKDLRRAHIKVSDLGESRWLVRSAECNTYCGTMAYLAPEVMSLSPAIKATRFARAERGAAGAAEAASGSCSGSCSGGGYGLPADMWSLGVVLYILLSGVPPFDVDEGPEALTRNVMQGRWSFDVPPWRSVSLAAQELVSGLLVQEPRQRLTIEQTLKHRWFSDAAVVAYAARAIIQPK